MTTRTKGWCVYRMFDVIHDLVYIGSTNDWGVRFAAHTKTSPWISEVCRIDFDFRGSECEVRQLERDAILAERPRYNKTHNREFHIPYATPWCDRVGVS